MNPFQSLEYPVCYSLIAIFALVFFAERNDASLSHRWMFSTWFIGHQKQYYRLISSGFVHAGLIHLLMNALGIYFFGTMVEAAAGPWLTLIIFLGSVVFGGIISGWLRRGDSDYQALGASGGVMGLLMCAILWFDGMKLGLFILPIFVPAWIFGIIFNLGSIVMTQTPDRQRISHEGHLGGALFGGLLGYIFTPQIIFSHAWLMFWLGIVPILLFVVLQTAFPKWFYRNK